jgi:hypothetical protein
MQLQDCLSLQLMTCNLQLWLKRTPASLQGPESATPSSTYLSPPFVSSTSPIFGCGPSSKSKNANDRHPRLVSEKAERPRDTHNPQALDTLESASILQYIDTQHIVDAVELFLVFPVSFLWDTPKCSFQNIISFWGVPRGLVQPLLLTS